MWVLGTAPLTGDVLLPELDGRGPATAQQQKREGPLVEVAPRENCSNATARVK